MDLEDVISKISGAQHPEDLFGKLTGTRDEMLVLLRAEHRQLRRIVNPVLFADPQTKAAVQKIFDQLEAFLSEAEDKIGRGVYGQRTVRLETSGWRVVKNGQTEYKVELKPFASGDICDLYRAVATGSHEHLVFKIAKVVADNDLVQNEARVIKHIRNNKDFERLLMYVPELFDSFKERGKQVNILKLLEGFYTLKEIREHYRQGVDPKDAAWMARRLLIALGLFTANGAVYGATTPEHIMIHPDHGLVLVDCSYGVIAPAKTGERISAIPVAYENWYPPEVKTKRMPTPATDLYMAAECMLYVMGGNPMTGFIPNTVPQEIQEFFRRCLKTSINDRPQEPWDLFNEFTRLIEKLWGPRKFRPFFMPDKINP